MKIFRDDAIGQKYIDIWSQKDNDDFLHYMKYEDLNYSHLGSNLFLVVYMFTIAKNTLIIDVENCVEG